MGDGNFSVECLLSYHIFPNVRAIAEVLVACLLFGILVVLIKLYTVYRDTNVPGGGSHVFSAASTHSLTAARAVVESMSSKQSPHHSLQKQETGYDSAKSEALRENILLIEQDLQPMQRTEPNFPDFLYEKGYLSASDCEMVVKSPPNLYGQLLALHLRKLDERSFQEVLSLIEATPYKHVAQAIKNSFIKNESNGTPKCPICLISREVDIFEFVALLFRNRLITEERYEMVIKSHSTDSNRKEIWRKIFDDAREMEKELYFLDQLKQLLSNSKYKSVHEKLSKHSSVSLMCTCEISTNYITNQADGCAVPRPCNESSSDNDSNTNSVPYQHDDNYEDAIQSSSSSEESYKAPRPRHKIKMGTSVTSYTGLPKKRTLQFADKKFKSRKGPPPIMKVTPQIASKKMSTADDSRSGFTYFEKTNTTLRRSGNGNHIRGIRRLETTL